MTRSPFRTLVEVSCDEGRAWHELSTREPIREITNAASDALDLCRERRFELAGALLDEAGARISALRDVPASLVSWLERLLHGSVAYHRYCVGDFERATLELLETDRAIRMAVSHDRFLLPLAHDCHELELHRARIARNAGRFGDMREHVAIARELLTSRRPLCELTDGTKVDCALLARYCQSLASYSEDARKAAEKFSFDNTTYHLRELGRFVQHIYLLPGFTAPPPPI